MRNPNDIAWIPMDPHFFWMSNNNRSIRIGSTEFSFGKRKNFPAIFDSGTSVTLVPPAIF